MKPDNDEQLGRFDQAVRDAFGRTYEALLLERGEPPWTFSSLAEFQKLVQEINDISSSSFFNYLRAARRRGYVEVTTEVHITIGEEL